MGLLWSCPELSPFVAGFVGLPSAMCRSLGQRLESTLFVATGIEVSDLPSGFFLMELLLFPGHTLTQE